MSGTEHGELDTSRKCAAASLARRLAGNALYAAGDYAAARGHYDAAASLAHRRSVDYALALANRAAACCGLGQYGAAVADCARCLGLVEHCVGLLPVGLVDKLGQRAELAERQLQQERAARPQASPLAVFKAAGGDCGAAAECGVSPALKVDYAAARGRGMVAADALPAGSLLIRETAFAHVLLQSVTAANGNKIDIAHTFCSCCMRRLPASWLPCAACADHSTVRYCDERCRDRAWKRSHSFECGRRLVCGEGAVGDQLFAPHVRRVARTVLGRPVADAIRYYRAAEGKEKRARSALSRHGAEGTGDGYGSDLYSVLTLGAHAKCDNDVYGLGFAHGPSWAHFASRCANWLALCGYFDAGDWPKDMAMNERRAVGIKLVVDVALKWRRNSMVVDTLDVHGGGGGEEQSVGAALYAHCSLLNHSCEPNAYRVWPNYASGAGCDSANEGGPMLEVYALRPIAAGEQVLISYGVEYPSTPVQARHKQLLRSHGFQCACFRCTDPASLRAECRLRAYKCEKCGGPAGNDREPAGRPTCVDCGTTSDGAAARVDETRAQLQMVINLVHTGDKGNKVHASKVDVVAEKMRSLIADYERLVDEGNERVHIVAWQCADALLRIATARRKGAGAGATATAAAAQQRGLSLAGDYFDRVLAFYAGANGRPSVQYVAVLAETTLALHKAIVNVGAAAAPLDGCARLFDSCKRQLNELLTVRYGPVMAAYWLHCYYGEPGDRLNRLVFA